MVSIPQLDVALQSAIAISTVPSRTICFISSSVISFMSSVVKFTSAAAGSVDQLGGRGMLGGNHGLGGSAANRRLSLLFSWRMSSSLF